MTNNPSVLLFMGSRSDLPALEGCIKILKDFDVAVEGHVLSAHRTPLAVAELAQNAAARGIKVIIAAAGKAAHLPGVIAAYTTLPVIGVPIKSSLCDGLDSLLSIVQMPNGIPVATVAVNGGDNAALLACQILALSDPALAQALVDQRKSNQEKLLQEEALEL